MDYYYKAVCWAAENGITSGINANQFGPDVTLSYDQIFAFLSKATGEGGTGTDWSQAAVNWAQSKGLTHELTFTPKDSCPRADVIYCLWNQMHQNEQTSGSGTKTDADIEEESWKYPTLNARQAATAAILNGFLEKQINIDVAPYHIESSELVSLAREIADIDGENPFGISLLNSYEHAGQQARERHGQNNGKKCLNFSGAQIAGSFYQCKVKLFRYGIYRNHHKRQEDINHAHYHRRIGIQQLQRFLCDVQRHQQPVKQSVGTEHNDPAVQPYQRIDPVGDHLHGDEEFLHPLF